MANKEVPQEFYESIINYQVTPPFFTSLIQSGKYNFFEGSSGLLNQDYRPNNCLIEKFDKKDRFLFVKKTGCFDKRFTDAGWSLMPTELKNDFERMSNIRKEYLLYFRSPSAEDFRKNFDIRNFRSSLRYVGRELTSSWDYCKEEIEEIGTDAIDSMFETKNNLIYNKNFLNYSIFNNDQFGFKKIGGGYFDHKVECDRTPIHALVDGLFQSSEMLQHPDATVGDVGRSKDAINLLKDEEFVVNCFSTLLTYNDNNFDKCDFKALIDKFFLQNFTTSNQIKSNTSIIKNIILGTEPTIYLMFPEEIQKNPEVIETTLKSLCENTELAKDNLVKLIKQINKYAVQDNSIYTIMQETFSEYDVKYVIQKCPETYFNLSNDQRLNLDNIETALMTFMKEGKNTLITKMRDFLSFYPKFNKVFEVAQSKVVRKSERIDRFDQNLIQGAAEKGLHLMIKGVSQEDLKDSFNAINHESDQQM